MTPPGRSGLRLLSPAFAFAFAATTVVALGGVTPACYAAGDGTAPPPNQIYFPVGLVVSKSGGVLYVANSDFDLQWNGGTVQSYDLTQVRRDTLLTIKDPTALATPFANHPYGKLTRPSPPAGSCPSDPPVTKDDGTGGRQPLNEVCAPPVDSTLYVKDSVTIGAFATDMQLSCSEAYLQPKRWPKDASGNPAYPCTPTRLFVPVRGDASVTWADIVPDDPLITPLPAATADDYAPFKLDCGVRVNGRCDGPHHAGNNAYEPNNTRNVTMPGEPFGMAQSEDGASIVVTHQTDTKVSLLATGFDKSQPGGPTTTPSLQYVLDGLPFGGNGIAAIPHDPDAFPTSGPGQASSVPNDAFLLTTRSAAEIDLLRFYPDQGAGVGGAPQNSSLYRPFLAKEAAFTLTANAGSTDSRGVIIDPTPRIRCKLAVEQNPPSDPAALAAAIQQCARRPARVFIANRTPATLLVGEIGEPSTDGSGSYDADRLVIYQNIPLTLGPSRIYLAPLVDADGRLSLRVFIVCFDSAALFVYNPETGVVENLIRVGQGPYAMAFDPFDLEAAARRDLVNDDPRLGSTDPDLTAKKYRFAYIASFTKSYIQVVDLDDSRISKDTFEKVVFTLGPPTAPKGTQ